MSLKDLAQRPVTYLRWTLAGEDEYGTPTYDHVPDAEPTDVWLEQTQATEVVVDENTQISDWLLVDPNPSAGITGRDRIDVDGVTYKVVGPPHVVHTPRGPHHVEARLQHVNT